MQTRSQIAAGPHKKRRIKRFMQHVEAAASLQPAPAAKHPGGFAEACARLARVAGCLDVAPFPSDIQAAGGIPRLHTVRSHAPAHRSVCSIKKAQHIFVCVLYSACDSTLFSIAC